MKNCKLKLKLFKEPKVLQSWRRKKSEVDIATNFEAKGTQGVVNP